MVRIEELMVWRQRKPKRSQPEMGYSKAQKYPDEVLEEVVKRCSKKKVQHSKYEATQDKPIVAIARGR